MLRRCSSVCGEGPGACPCSRRRGALDGGAGHAEGVGDLLDGAVAGIVERLCDGDLPGVESARRPPVRPRARAAASPSRVLATISSRWSSARTDSIPNIAWPSAVVVSMPCSVTWRPTPRSRSSAPRLGARWRHEARLPSYSQLLDAPRPLTPAPFESQIGRITKPARREAEAAAARRRDVDGGGGGGRRDLKEIGRARSTLTTRASRRPSRQTNTKQQRRDRQTPAQKQERVT